MLNPNNSLKAAYAQACDQKDTAYAKLREANNNCDRAAYAEAQPRYEAAVAAFNEAYRRWFDADTAK